MVGPNFRVGKKIGCGNFGELRLGEKGLLLSSLSPPVPGLPWHPLLRRRTGRARDPQHRGSCLVLEPSLPSLSFLFLGPCTGLRLSKPIAAHSTYCRGVSHLFPLPTCLGPSGRALLLLLLFSHVCWKARVSPQSGNTQWVVFHRIILALKSIESDHNLTVALSHVPQSLILYIPFHELLLCAHQVRCARAGVLSCRGAVLRGCCPPAACSRCWGERLGSGVGILSWVHSLVVHTGFWRLS